MKIHFVAAVDGDQLNYKKITEVVQKLGHKLITNHYLIRKADEIDIESELESKKFAKKCKEWILSADIVIFEITRSDANIGFETALVLEHKKPLIILYQAGGTVPRSFKVFEDNSVQLCEYTNKNLESVITEAIDFVDENQDQRFNLMLSSDLVRYLDEKSISSGRSKASIIRTLILDQKLKDGR